MAVFNEPTKWQTSLVNSGDANTIPQTTPAGTGEASFEDGFPQITQVPIGAGGIAPDRKDFNGLFKVLGDWIFFAQNGGLPTYSASFDYVVGRYVVYNNTLYKCIQANGASSTVVAPNSVSPLGSDYWVQIATLADFVNFANTDLSNLSASGQALFTNKADISFSNVNNTANILMAHNAMPSDTKINLTLGSSSYTAPADGFFLLSGTSTGGGQQLLLSSNSCSVRVWSVTSGQQSIIYIPVKKSDVVAVTNTMPNNQTLFFIYAVGSESEQ